MRIYQNLADASWLEKIIYCFDLISNFFGYLLAIIWIGLFVWVILNDARKNK
jgi:VanZ family protein